MVEAFCTIYVAVTTQDNNSQGDIKVISKQEEYFLKFFTHDYMKGIMHDRIIKKKLLAMTEETYKDEHIHGPSRNSLIGSCILKPEITHDKSIIRIYLFPRVVEILEWYLYPGWLLSLRRLRIFQWFINNDEEIDLGGRSKTGCPSASTDIIVSYHRYNWEVA